jgi:FMN phosphatase YigB (HAD superfamily)
MEERIEVVALTCECTIVDLHSGVEAVLCRTARRHGEAPLDRGRALRRRLEAMPCGSFAAAYEALARERGYRWAGPGDLALAAAAAGSRPVPDVQPTLESVRAAGLRLVALSERDPRLVEAALRPLDGAFDEVLAGCGLAAAVHRIGVPPQRILHVAAGRAAVQAARALGMRTAWLNRWGAHAADGAPCELEWRTLDGLRSWLAAPVGAAR